MSTNSTDQNPTVEYLPGEVWRAQNGDEWFVVFEPGHDEPHMVNDVRMVAPSSFIEDSYGPLTRKYTPGGAE